MAVKILKEMVPQLFELLREFDVYGPVEESGKTRFRRLAAPPTLEYENSDKPAKEALFPQTEKMLDLKREGPRFVGAEEPDMDGKEIIIFGARPCDVRAIAALDKLFNWDYQDPYYNARRERATIIALACVQPGMPLDNCFCTSVGGGPASKEGADMLWIDVGRSYHVESLTEKGERFLKLGGELFLDSDEEHGMAAKEAVEKAEAAITRRLDTAGVMEALEENFASDYWSGFSERCLGCGICTLLCPTCYCFDINDIVMFGEGRRERTWDTCQNAYYTIHASGHNPRPDKRERQRNRINHKYLYMQKRLGVPGCVGCGRCISKCPVNIDIIEVIEGIKEVARE